MASKRTKAGRQTKPNGGRLPARGGSLIPIVALVLLLLPFVTALFVKDISEQAVKLFDSAAVPIAGVVAAYFGINLWRGEKS